MYQKKAAQLKEERSQIVENYKTLVSKNDKLRLVENIFLYSRVLTRAQKKDPSIKSLYIPKDMPGHEELQEVVNFRYNIMPKLPVENANRAFLRSKENECKKANQPFVLSEAVQKYKLITPEEKEKFAKLSEKDIERYICEVRQLVGIN